MTITHIKNAAIVTLDVTGTIRRSANLLIESDRILTVGNLPENIQPDQVVDASGRLILPGLVNSHCHSPMTFLRGWAEDMLFPDWLQKVWSAENYLAPEDVYWSAALSAVEMIRSGTTAFADLYFFRDCVADVVEKSGLKALLGWGVFDAGQGIFDVPGGCISAHTLYIDERDTELLAEKGVFVPHCPNTYMKLAMPFPSLKPRLDAGVKVCLGTDGPASNANMDMFASLRQTALIHKYQQGDPTMLPGDAVLRLAARTGAEALGFANSGVIRAGAAADLIMLNLDVPHMRPLHNLTANLVHSATAADVTDVMVDGQC